MRREARCTWRPSAASVRCTEAWSRAWSRSHGRTSARRRSTGCGWPECPRLSPSIPAVRTTWRSNMIPIDRSRSSTSTNLRIRATTEASVDDFDDFINTSGFVRGPHDLAGKFITFEGCEGSGKTTQATMLYNYLVNQGKDVILCREPGGTHVGEKIRDILLDPEIKDIFPITEALLFAADRTQQVMQVIRPALAKGWIVIADRFVDSSLAYQGVGGGCGLEAVKNLNDWACGNIEPNLTIFLDLKVREGLERAASARGLDRIEPVSY